MNSDLEIQNIKKLCIIMGAAVSVSAIIVFPIEVGIGTSLGCLAGVLNFFWLEQAVSGIFTGEENSKKTIYLVKYLFRFLLIAGLLCVIMLDRRMHVKSMIGIAVGFSVPPAAAFVGGLLFRKKRI